MKEELHEPQERREEQVEECKSESSQEEFVVPQRTRETLYSLIGEQKQELASINAQIDKAAATEDFDMAEALSAKVELINLEINRLQQEAAELEPT